MEIEKRKTNTSMIPELSVICVSLGVLLLGVWLYEPGCFGECYSYHDIVIQLVMISPVILGVPNLAMIFYYKWERIFLILFIVPAIYMGLFLLTPGGFLFITRILSTPGGAIMTIPQPMALVTFILGFLFAVAALLYDVFYPDDLELPRTVMRLVSLTLSFSASSYWLAILTDQMP